MIKLPIKTIVLSAFIIGCNKQKINTKRIEGNWNVVSYSKTNNEGMTTKFLNCQGSIDFKNPELFNLKIYYFSSGGLADSISAEGMYQLDENGSSVLFKNSNGLNIGETGNYRILTLTSTDLQIEGGDTLGNVNTYLFSKK